MKSVHYYPNTCGNRSSKRELAVFALVLLLAAALLALLCLAGCANPAPVGETVLEHKLQSAQTRQLSAAAAAVDAAKVANDANPEGTPKIATAGELAVADANLPPAQVEDAREALARVNAALTGKLAEAQQAWQEAQAKGAALQNRLDDLQKQVVAERAAAVAKEKQANERLCVVSALSVGGGLFVAAALALALGLYFGLPKLDYGAAALGLCGGLAFFAATQVGSTHFNLLATVIIIGALVGVIYTVWQGFQGGAALQAKAGGFDAVFSAIRNFAGEVAADAETDAKELWHWLGSELDAAHKALVADWQKLEAAFSPAKPTSLPATSTATAHPVASSGN